MPAWTCASSTDGPRARLNALLLRPWVKPAVLLGCALPLVWLITAALADRLGANPAEALIRALGDWTLRLLCLTLAVTPLRRWCGLSALARWRRGLGLWAFCYGLLHLLAYAWLDQALAWREIGADVVQRPFIAAGLAAWLIMLPLAATSFDAVIRWLGAARWRCLHRAVYPAAGLALLHFYWMRSGKNDQAEVWLYVALVVVLLAARWPRR